MRIILKAWYIKWQVRRLKLMGFGYNTIKESLNPSDDLFMDRIISDSFLAV